jgi:hypothetical protein
MACSATPFVGTLSTGQPNAALHERRLVKLIRASAEPLHKTKLRRSCQERVAPQARYDEHIGFMRPPLQLFQRAHLKVRDTGSPRGQFLRPAIGDVREADRQSVAGRKSRAVQHVHRNARRHSLRFVIGFRMQDQPLSPPAEHDWRSDCPSFTTSPPAAFTILIAGRSGCRIICGPKERFGRGESPHAHEEALSRRSAGAIDRGDTGGGRNARHPRSEARRTALQRLCRHKGCLSGNLSCEPRSGRLRGGRLRCLWPCHPTAQDRPGSL